MLNRRGPNSNSTTGVRGVCIADNGHGYTYYRVRFIIKKKWSKSKNFPLTPEGFAAACALAIEQAKEVAA